MRACNGSGPLVGVLAAAMCASAAAACADYIRCESLVCLVCMSRVEVMGLAD
jgi:hypothetical protein